MKVEGKGTYFFSKWSRRIFAYDDAHIVPMAQPTGVLVKLLFYSFYYLWICVQGFNIKRYEIGVIWDRFYYV